MTDRRSYAVPLLAFVAGAFVAALVALPARPQGLPPVQTAEPVTAVQSNVETVSLVPVEVVEDGRGVLVHEQTGPVCRFRLAGGRVEVKAIEPHGRCRHFTPIPEGILVR